MAGVQLARRGAVITGATQELFPGFVADGPLFRWSDDPTLSNPNFSLNNYALTTDGGQPALRHATGHEFDEASIFTARTDITAARFMFLYRAEPNSGLGITNISLRSQIRYTDANNYWQIARDRGAGASWMLPVERVAGTNVNHAVLGGDTALDNTDSTTYQWFVMDVYWDVIRAKEWFVTGSDPGWKGVFRNRPMSGWGGANDTAAPNTPQTGQVGLRAMYGGILQDIICIPLKSSRPSNLMLNAALDPELVDSSGRPFFWGWDSKWNSETTGIIELSSGIGPDGSTTIPVLRCARSTPGSGGDGPEATQEFYITPAGGADNASFTRDEPTPTVGAAFPTAVNCSAWVKTTNLANTLVQIGTAQHVLYYSDAAGTGLNVTHNDYYGPIAPDTGSQPWTLVTWTTPIHNNTDAVIARLFEGMHDERGTGEVLIAGGAWAPTFELAA